MSPAEIKSGMEATVTVGKVKGQTFSIEKKKKEL